MESLTTNPVRLPSHVRGIPVVPAKSFGKRRLPSHVRGILPAAFAEVNGRTKLLRSSGLGIGLDHGELFDKTLVVEQHIFNPGDLISLYTDGVTENRNSKEKGLDTTVSYGVFSLLAMNVHRESMMPYARR